MSPVQVWASAPWRTLISWSVFRCAATCLQTTNDRSGKRFSGPDSAVDGGSSNGRTTVFGTVNRGSNPCPPAFPGVGSPRPELNAVGKRYFCWTTKYGAYSSKAERLIVDQKVAGSSPARRPSVRLCLRSSWRDSGIQPTLFLLLGNEETTI